MNGTSLQILWLAEARGNPAEHDQVSWYWFKLLESDTRRLIIGIFKYSAIWKKVSWYSTAFCAQRGITTSKLFKVHITSPVKKLDSRDRLPVLP